ncbi:MAG TPA: hypothetical protein VFN67_34260 [Polyangiales bacterium]|nr:hypothetical protein [Polyangiales bacterium]
MKRQALALCLMFGCRIGGGSGANVDWKAGRTIDASTRREVAPVVGGMDRRDASATPAVTDAADPTTSADAKTTNQPTVCAPPAVGVCNPVTNTGCTEAAMQCDVDPDQSVLAGRCVLSTPFGEGELCLSSFVSESCDPKTTCSDEGNCRQLCFCDSECGPGRCCSEPFGTLGFMLCTACR